MAPVSHRQDPGAPLTWKVYRPYHARMSRGIALVLALSAAACSSAAPPSPGGGKYAPARVGDVGLLGGNGGDLVARESSIRAGGGIAARINDEIITWKDVEDTVRTLKPGEITDELRHAKRRELAERRLFLQAARQNQIRVTEQELDDQIQREIRNYGGAEEFERNLRVSGITKTEYREKRRRDLLVLKLHRHLLQKSWMNPDHRSPGLMFDTVTPEEIRRFYDQNRSQYRKIEHLTAWRIALQFSTLKLEKIKRAIAESLLRKLEEGADFSLLAHFYSDLREHPRGWDREKAAEYFAPETVALLFDTMKVGDVSGIVKDGQTLNLFKLEQHVNQREETFEEAQARIRRYLESERREENRKRLRDHLIKGAYLWPPDLFRTE